MSKFNQNYVKAIKYFILSGSEKVSNLKKNQNDHLQQITHGKNLECSALEIFDEDEFFKVTFIEKCETIIDTIPIILFKNEFHDKILNFNKFSSKCLMNIGLRVSLNEPHLNSAIKVSVAVVDRPDLSIGVAACEEVTNGVGKRHPVSGTLKVLHPDIGIFDPRVVIDE